MKRLMIIGLWPDDVVKYCTEKCDCRRYAFDRILYHRGGRDARERICIPVVDRSGAVTTYLDLPVLFLEANAVYLHLDDGSDIFLSNTQMLLIANEVERLRAEAAGTGLKTLEKWFESGLPTAEDYLEPGDEVDADLIDYFLNVLPPRTNRAGLLQVGGEISTAKDANGHWRPTYLTFKRQGGKTIGYFAWKMENTALHLLHLYLRPEYRGKALGRDILATCERLARGEGRGRLYCEVHTKCLPVLQFFKTKGYRVLGPAEAEAAGIPMQLTTLEKML